MRSVCPFGLWMYMSVCLFVRLLVSMVMCSSKMFRYLTPDWMAPVCRLTDMELTAMHFTTGHVVSAHPFARSFARPLARLIHPFTHSSAHPPIHPLHPLTQPAHPIDRCRILSVIMARSQKSIPHNSLNPGHVVSSLPRKTACSGTAGRSPSLQPSHKIVNLQADWPRNNSILCGRIVF